MQRNVTEELKALGKEKKQQYDQKLEEQSAIAMPGLQPNVQASLPPSLNSQTEAPDEDEEQKQRGNPHAVGFASESSILDPDEQPEDSNQDKGKAPNKIDDQKGEDSIHDVRAPLPEQLPAALIPLDYLRQEAAALAVFKSKKNPEDLKQEIPPEPGSDSKNEDGFVAQQQAMLDAIVSRQKPADPIKAPVETQEIPQAEVPAEAKVKAKLSREAFIAEQKAALVKFIAEQKPANKAALEIYMTQEAEALAAFDLQQHQAEGEKENQRNIILPTLTEKDFICPITHKIIRTPSIAKPCRHLFEKIAIDELMRKQGEGKTHALCPCCDTPIEAVDPPKELFFTNFHKELLEKNPRLQKPSQQAEGEKEDEGKIILPTLKEEDFICPITREIIRTPSIAKPCRHFFEKKAIDQWIQRERNKSKEPLCPCCRGRIETVEPPEELFFIKFHKELLDKNPHLQELSQLVSSDFSLRLLNDCFVNRSKSQLERMIALLKNSKDLMNVVSEEEGFEGLTAVAVFAAYKKGLEALADDSELLKTIQPQGLNAIAARGISAVTWLAMWREGWILLNKNPSLYDLIQAEGLNARGHTGTLRNRAAVYWFAKFMDFHEAFSHTRIINLIGPEAFNSLGQDNDPPLYYFAAYEKGQRYLLANPRLCGLITREALLAPVKGKTAADWFKNTPLGHKILARHPHLREKMGLTFNLQRLDTLLTKNDQKSNELQLMLTLLEEDKTLMNQEDKDGLTAAHVLASREAGLIALLERPNLRNNIQLVGLNAICAGGQNQNSLFKTNAHKRYNAICAGGQNQNSLFKTNAHKRYTDLSAVYWFMKSKRGREILLADDARLFSLISEKAFYKIVENGPEKDKTPAYWLQHSPEIKKLLLDRPALGQQLKLGHQVTPPPTLEGDGQACKIS